MTILRHSMRRWWAGGLVFLAAGAPLSLCRAELIEDPQLFKFRMTDGSLELLVEQEKETRERSGVEGTLKKETFLVEPLLELFGEGSVYHPRLLDFSARAEVGLSHQNKRDDAYENTPSGRHGKEDDFVQNYLLNAALLNRKPYATFLTAGRDTSDRDDDFFTRVKVDSEYYEARSGYSEGPVPVSVSARRVELNSDGTVRPFTDREDTLAVGANNRRGIYDYTRFHYELEDFEHTERGFPTEQGTRHTVGLSDAQSFRSDGKYQLFSSASYQEQDRNDVDTSTVNVNEQATIQHDDRWQSRYRYAFVDQDSGPAESVRHDGLASLRHQLYDSLVSTFELEGREEKDTSPGSELTATRYGGGVAEDYTKRLGEWGRLTINAGVRAREEERDAFGGTRVVIDERVRLTDGEVTLLGSTDVDTTTIVVTDPTSTTTFREPFDYTVLPRGRSTQILRTVGGQIPNGSTVLVDYRAESQPSDRFSTREQLYGVRLDFFDRLLGIYARRFLIENRGAENLVLQDVDDVVFGMDLTWKGLRAGIEYEDYDTNLSPYRTWRLFQNLNLYPTRTSSLFLGMRQQHTRFEDSGNPEKTYSFICRYRTRLTRSIATSLEGGAYFERGIGEADLERTRYTVRAYADYWIGQLTTRLNYEYEDTDFENETTESHLASIRLIRDL